MNTNLQGNIGEAKALEYFVSQGYEVFLPFGTASSIDMIICKEGECQRVSVKTTTMKSRGRGWIVRIKQSGRGKEKPFDPETSDIIFVYIIPENRITILKSKEVESKFEMTVY